MIDEGEIVHVSIEAGFRDAEIVNGVKPKGLHFTGLALLTKDVPPGIPLTRIYKSTVKKVEGEISPTCHICGEKMSEIVDLGGFQVHPQCAQGFWSVAAKIFRLSERALAPHDGPLAPEDREWNVEEAEERIRRWASSDGSGNKDKIDWDKYRQAFAWYDHEDSENFKSYKLPHHDVIDGRLHVVWRGVVSAMQALMGARGGVNVPPEDRRGIYIHLANHYRQFGRDPPKFESVMETYAKMLEQAVEEQRKTIQNLIIEKKRLEERIRAAKRQIRMVLKL